MINYALEIDRAKQAAIDALNSQAAKLESSAYEIMLKVIDDTFDVKAGQIVADADFVSKLNKLTDEVISLIQQAPEFKGSVSQFVKRLNGDVSSSISDFQQAVNGVVVPAFEEAKKVAVDETIEQLLGNGLNQNFVQPLRDLIYQNVTNGLSLSQAKQQIKEYIQGGKDASGKLSRYIDQTAQQAVDTYSGVINKKLLETFEYNALLVTGSIIDNSSPQCRYVIEDLSGKIKRDQWGEVKDHVGVNTPLIPGTTFDTLPIMRLHWGCRHSFYPIVLKQNEGLTVEEAQKAMKDYKPPKEQQENVLDYSKNGFRSLNGYLRTGKIPKIFFEAKARSEESVKEQINSINNFIDNAPKVKDVSYRGIKFNTVKDFEEFNKMISSSDEIIDKGFISTTYDKETLWRHTDASYKVVVEIAGKNGVLIENFSHSPEEKEILFRNGTKLKVISIKTTNNLTEVKLEEL